LSVLFISRPLLRTQLALRRELRSDLTERLDEILAAAGLLMSEQARSAMAETANAAPPAAEEFRRNAI
jgi:hypothetical protein